jgi:DNA-binding LacI/PurR family transcriptional regulator
MLRHVEPGSTGACSSVWVLVKKGAYLKASNHTILATLEHAENHVNMSSDLPLYEAIKRDLQARIESGELPEGARILPEIELAKQVGVSRSTARKALQALEMEGYLSRTAGRGSFVKARRKQPDTTAGPGRSTLAVTLFHIERFNHAGDILQGFMNTAVAAGHHAMVHPQLNGAYDEFEYLVNLRRSGIEGWALWLVKATQKNVNLLRNFQKSGNAIVLVDRYARALESDYVVTCNEKMAYVLTRELTRRGHETIALINFMHDNTVAEDRHAGYVRALSEADIPAESEYIITDTIQGPEALRMQILALLGLRRRPTAVFCATAHHAWFVAEELQRLGYTIPGDVELAVVDDNRMQEQVEFPILAAVQQSYEMGCMAAEMLQKRLQEPGMPWQKAELGYTLNFEPLA